MKETLRHGCSLAGYVIVITGIDLCSVDGEDFKCHQNTFNSSLYQLLFSVEWVKTVNSGTLVNVWNRNSPGQKCFS